MAQKAKKEGESLEKPSIAVKEKRPPTERRELIEDQRFAKKKGETAASDISPPVSAGSYGEK